MNCVACNITIKREDILICSSCKNPFHYICVNMTSSFFTSHTKELKRTWRCPSCTTSTSRRKCEETPVRKQFESDFEDTVKPDNELKSDSSARCTVDKSPDRSYLSYQHFADLLETKLSSMQSNISNDFKKELDSAIQKIKTEFTDSIEFLTSQLTETRKEYGALRDRVQALEQENVTLHNSLAHIKSIQLSSSDLNNLQETINRMNIESNEREQQSLLNDIEISGIPEQDGESVVHLTMSIAAKLGYQLEQHDIVYATRVGVKRHTNADAGAVNIEPKEDSRSPRPRPIVVRLIRRCIRDELLRHARVRRRVTTDGLGLAAHTPNIFHVNERLTKFNRALFAKSRDLGKSLHWRFVWTKLGRVFARKDDSSQVHILRSEKDINHVFGIVSPQTHP